MTYTLIVKNAQGATETKTGTNRAQVNLLLAEWQDPQNLSAWVTDRFGWEVAIKPTGRKRLIWAKWPHYELDCE